MNCLPKTLQYVSTQEAQPSQRVRATLCIIRKFSWLIFCDGW